MVETPEKIWAIEKGYPSRYRVSCSVLEHGPDEATEYVRADLYAALEEQLAEARKALGEIEQEARSLPLHTSAVTWEHVLTSKLAVVRDAARRALTGVKEDG